MLKNAKEARENYVNRVKEIGDMIIANIINLETLNYWEDEMNDDREIDITEYVEQETDIDVDINDVYDYLDCICITQIDEENTVAEALKQVFNISCWNNRFTLTFKPIAVKDI